MPQEQSLYEWKRTENAILEDLFRALLKEVTGNLAEQMKKDPPKRDKFTLFMRKIFLAIHLTDEKTCKELDDIYFGGAGMRYELAVKYAQNDPEELERIGRIKPLLDALYTVPRILKKIDRKQSATERLKVFINIFLADPELNDVDAILQYLKVTEYGSDDFWQTMQKFPTDVKEKVRVNIKGQVSDYLNAYMKDFLEQNPEIAAVFG